MYIFFSENTYENNTNIIKLHIITQNVITHNTWKTR